MRNKTIQTTMSTPNNSLMDSERTVSYSFQLPILKIIKSLFTSIVFTKTYELQELVTASGVVAQEVSR